MLIYNHNKSLVAIDDETLHHLGYKTLAAFLQDHDDVAELFVKKPGYIHNFQNFPWIDFVLHADAEDTKAIIQTEKKHFSFNIAITPIYMTDAPEQQGYVIHFKHIKSLSGENDMFVRQEDADDEAPLEIDEESPLGTSLGSIDTLEPTILQEPDTLDIPDLPPIELPEINPDGSLNEKPVLETPSQPASKEERPMLGDYINKDEAAFLKNLKVSDDYKYDPHIAAEELGLPVELIEEFIGDFIQQSNEFKDDLFDAALKEDYDEVHVLSHKLKGVAANLRIEDAFEVLAIINNSRDQIEIEANLKQFYRIIAKMEGKAVPDFRELEAEESFDTPLDNGDDDDIYDIGMLLDDTPKMSTSDSLDESLLMDELLETPEADEEAETPQESETILPESEKYLVESAEESKTFKQMSGDIASDAYLQSGPDFEPLKYDVKNASMELGVNESFVRELIHEFVTEAKARRSELTKAIEQDDMLGVQSIAMEFKGLADNLRIKQLSESLGRLMRDEHGPAAKKEAEHIYGLLEQL